MKLINTERRKLINAIMFFANSLKHPTKVNIFKMLFFSDFEHFSKTGRSITGLEYFAWPFGPVPKTLHEEMVNDRPPEDMRDYFVTDIQVDEINDDLKTVLFKAKAKPNMSVFSERELEILNKVSFIYKDTLPSTTSQITHEENSFWNRTLKSKGERGQIDYLLALDDSNSIDIETAKERIDAQNEMKSLFGDGI